MFGAVATPYINTVMKPLSKRKQNMLKNSIEAQNQIAQWVNIAMNLYEWEGLPDTVSARIIELSFLLRGCAMITEIDGSLYSLLASGGYDYTMYGEPSRAWGYGLNGFTKDCKIMVAGADEGILLRDTTGSKVDLDYNAVFGWDNQARYPYINYILNSALRLADIKRSEDVVRNNSKKPAIVTCEESMVKSVKEAFDAKDENNSVIVMSVGGMTLDSVKVFPIQIDTSLMKEFADAFQREQNYLREVFGIASLPNTDKRERLITDEANANNEYTDENGDIRLNMRKRFCEAVNLAFGTNISVKLKEQPVERDIREEDEENGTDNDVL